MSKKIGLLAYNSANNFGALLQLQSSYMYLKKHGFNPVIINYSPADLLCYYSKTTPLEQLEVIKNFREKYWVETALCKTSHDIAQVIENCGIEGVIIGSDAIVQHHTFRERLSFPTKTIFSVRDYTSDRMFPNPFWGDFIRYLTKKIPVVMMSGSSQNSNYILYGRTLRKRMKEMLSEFDYISVRDSWTQKMISYITDGAITPLITPDPVFSYRQNVGSIVPSEEIVRKKYGIDGKYFLYSFHNKEIPKSWIESLIKLCDINGYKCYCLPFANKPSSLNIGNQIPFPISPIDWYSLIKYSSGYLGNNMHPIIIALNSSVPFFSFDNYGKSTLNRLFVNEKSSKIYDVIKEGNLLQYRVGSFKRNFAPPSVEFVFNKLVSFDFKCANEFSNLQQLRYEQMMSNIIKCFL